MGNVVPVCFTETEANHLQRETSTASAALRALLVVPQHLQDPQLFARSGTRSLAVARETVRLLHGSCSIVQIKVKVKVKEAYSSLQAGLPSPLRELTYHMGSHSVTCHPAEVTFPPLPQLKLVGYSI